MTEPIPAHAETVGVATVTYSPTVILNGVKSLSYAANMQATRIAKAQGADEAVLVQPDGIVLEPPTSTIFWVSPQGGLRTPGARHRRPRVDHPRPPGQGAHVEEGAWPVADLRAAQRGVPRLDHPRDPSRLRDRRRRAARARPGPRTREAAGGLRRRLSAGSSDRLNDDERAEVRWTSS